MRPLAAAPLALALLSLAGVARAEAAPAASTVAVEGAAASAAAGKRDHATKLGIFGAVAFFALCAAAVTTDDRPSGSKSAPKR
ncbi:MAG: hypothetical protein IT376_20705 [Polyangiaceae bacterium]|nr:hypothetical protein [Polyangiaceae bacterium]